MKNEEKLMKQFHAACEKQLDGYLEDAFKEIKDTVKSAYPIFYECFLEGSASEICIKIVEDSSYEYIVSNTRTTWRELLGQQDAETLRNVRDICAEIIVNRKA